MDHPLIQYFSRLTPLTQEEKTAIIASMNIRHYPKGTYMLRRDWQDASSFFLVKGLVRQYYVTEGNEVTINLYQEGEWIIALADFAEIRKAEHYLVCLEDTEAVTGNEAGARELFREFPRFEAIARAVTEQAFAEERARNNAFRTDSPEQRYRKLLEQKPGLLQRVPQYYIASYLGIQPGSLSRIRKRLSGKN